MLSKLLGKRKNGFTLIELLLACSIFAILVSGVIIAINRSFSFMNDTKLRIKATNFAREGVEIMFNIRDTNWRRHSGKRDENRLDVGQLESTDTLESGIYVIKEATTTTNDKYFYADKLNISNGNIETFYSDDGFWGATFSTQRESAKIQFDGDYKYMQYSNDNWVEQTGSIQDLLLKESDYYRIVRVFGVYCKTANNSNTPVSNTQCKEFSDPKEMRFCVKVFYSNNATKNTSELCSIMTNFTE